MKIYRDGIAIELTAEELNMAYEEKHMQYFQEDVRSRAEDMEVEISDDDCWAIAQRFDKAIGRNDSYWDDYWSTLECVIEEYIEEGK